MTEPLDTRVLLDLEAAARLADFPVDIGTVFGALSDDNVAAVRAGFGAAAAVQLSEFVERADHAVPGTEGVTVRVHRTVGNADLLPCVVWMHGGGLVMGSKDSDDVRFDNWCPELGCVGVSIDYRLAPETPYPGPLEDCYAALCWVHEHATSLGIDPGRIGIGGSSAGGGLAAGLALLARDRGGPAIAFQCLIYPMIDDRQITVSSQWPDPVWPPAANTYGWTAYLGNARGGPDVPIYAAAARATDLRGLPPTQILVGAIDGFSDEDIDYAVRLRHAGVPVELHVYAGAPHGFDALLPSSELARRARLDVEHWLRARLG